MKLNSRGPWIAALTALALGSIPLRSEAVALPILFQGTWTIELDRHFYRADPGLLSVDAGIFALVATSSLANCQRSNGATQLVGSSALTYAAGLREVYLELDTQAYELSLDANGAVLELNSTTGDIVCDGEITPPGTLFANGYE